MNKTPKARVRRSKSSPVIDQPGTPGLVPTAGRCDVLPLLPSTDAVHIDEEFRGLIPPLSADERARLERSLLVEGCLHALTVWAPHGILLDGHNRLEICRTHGLPFRTVEVRLPDREAARAWIIANQLARRNLTRLGIYYLRGQCYLALKRQGQRPDVTLGTNDCDPGYGNNEQGEGPKSTSGRTYPKRTSEQLAPEFGVGERTIRKDAAFAAAVNAVAAACGEEVRRLILSRDGRLSRDDVEWWAEQPAEDQRCLLKVVRATGRLDRLRDPGAEKCWMRVPREPVALSETLLRRLDPQAIAALSRLLSDGLQELGRDGR